MTRQLARKLTRAGYTKHVFPTFMIRSGLNVPTPAIPIPAFAVPYAAPAAVSVSLGDSAASCEF